MKFRDLFAQFLLALSVCIMLAPASFGQRATGTPKKEKLLNGLNVLLWSEPSSEKVTVKLRINSGAAFDPAGREGLMSMLAESIFPNSDSREFFADELGGGLSIETNYDYIQITTSSRTKDYLTLLETLSSAIANMQLDKNAVAAYKTTQTAKTSELLKDPSYRANMAVAARLFGSFPYGRPVAGTPNSVAKIDFADMIFAKDRFLTADNATMAISGDIDTNAAFRAVRRYFGSWLKADSKVPATFRQPDDPDKKVLEIAVPELKTSEVRYAIRGLARSDKDFAAAEVLGRVLNARFAKQGAGDSDSSVTNQYHLLPGSFVFSYRSSASPTLPVPQNNQVDRSESNSPISALFNEISESEFASARSSAVSWLEGLDRTDRWLDVDTFKLVSVDADAKAFSAVTLADVQRLAGRLEKQPVASIVLVVTPGTSAKTDQ